MIAFILHDSIYVVVYTVHVCMYMYRCLLYCAHIHIRTGHMRYGRVDAPVPSKSTSAPLTSLSKKSPVYPSSRLSTTSSTSSSYTHHTNTNINNTNTNSAYTPIPPECFASRLPVPLPPYPDDVPTPGV